MTTGTLSTEAARRARFHPARGSGGRRWLPRLLVLPTLLYLFPIYFGSLLILFTFSFFTYVPGGQLLNPAFTLANYRRFFDSLYIGILGRTIVIGFIASLAAVLLAYPMAYWFNRSTSRWRSVILSVVVLSFFVIAVVRVFSWTLVLGREGFVNKLLLMLHVIERPIQLMYNDLGVTLVLAHYLLPVTTLVLTTALQRIDPDLESASQNLGATKTYAFVSVTLPLSVPGIVGAFTLAFAMSISTFTTPVIIGGGRVLLLANTLYDTMFSSMNFPFASALAMVTLLFSLVLVGLIGRVLMAQVRLE